MTRTAAEMLEPIPANVLFWELAADRAQLSTPVVVHDRQGTLVCDGAFTWTLRRRDA